MDARPKKWPISKYHISVKHILFLNQNFMENSNFPLSMQNDFKKAVILAISWVQVKMMPKSVKNCVKQPR